MQINDSATIFVCHSFDDKSQDTIEEFSRPRYIHIDISQTPFNKHANEATAAFAIDSASLDDSRFYGLCHYRRYIPFEDSELAPNTIVCTTDRLCTSIYNHFGQYHCIEYFKQFYTAFIDMHSQKWKDECAAISSYFFDEAMPFYSRNIFIAEGKLFKEWLQYLRDCIDINHAMYKISASSPIWNDRYQLRQPAFVIERMTSLWLHTKQQQGCKLDIKPYIELPIASPYQRA